MQASFLAVPLLLALTPCALAQTCPAPRAPASPILVGAGGAWGDDTLGPLRLPERLALVQDPVAVEVAGDGGEFSIPVDMTAIPVSPTGAVVAGDSWSFQAWFRDANPAPTRKDGRLPGSPAPGTVDSNS